MEEIYHILNRGVDKRIIFLDEQDYFRFVHDLFEFNDQELINTTFHIFKKTENNVIGLRNIKKPRKLLVSIHAFCLIPNHYHLLLSPCVDNGIPKFMHKLNKGYSRYFNIKHERKGTLFEGKYKSILVAEEPHFYYLPYYIHFNPLDLKFPEWREKKLKNYKGAVDFLNNYRWSSHLDYCGIKNFPSITNREFLSDVFEGNEKYKSSVGKWLKDLELEMIKDLALE